MRPQRKGPVSSPPPQNAPERGWVGDGKPPAPACVPAANERRATDEAKQPAGDAAAAFPPFSPIELLVIAIGERDPLTLAAGSCWARLRRTLFGIEVPRPFADRRLEALRALAIALRRRSSPDAALEAALAAGVTPDQIQYLRSRGSDLKANSERN